MAGLLVPVEIQHRPRGVVRTDVDITLDDADGTLAATVVGVGYGRLVGYAIDWGNLGAGTAVITVKDNKGLATLLTLDADNFDTAALFGSTTTGDETGGAAADLFTTGAAHGLVAGDVIVFTAQTGSTLPAVGARYYVDPANLTATTFRLSTDGLGTPDVELDGDISAASWVNHTNPIAPMTPLYKRPSVGIQGASGSAISGHANSPNVNRDIIVAGKVSVAVADGFPGGVGTLSLIVDESGLGDIAITV
jgi:hypothetical protein